MPRKIIALGAALVLVSLAAVGAFAAQDPVDLLDHDTPVESTTEGDGDHGIPEDNPAFDDVEGDCNQHESDVKETDSGNEVTVPCNAVADEEEEDAAEEEVDDEEDATDEEQDAEDNEGPHGIPEDNPVFEDVDGDCDKHEADVKVTPSGNEVRVPCHVVEKLEDAERSGRGHDDEGDNEDDVNDEDDGNEADDVDDDHDDDGEHEETEETD